MTQSSQSDIGLRIAADELSELICALDHRLAEAENGNAYARWEQCGAMLRRALFYGGTPNEIGEHDQRMLALQQVWQ